MEDKLTFNIKDVEIEKIFFADKNRDGKAYVSSKGDAFTKVDIYITDKAVDDIAFAGKMSMFDFKGKSAEWKVGDKITGTVTKNGDYWNFDTLKEMKGDTAFLNNEINQLKADIETLYDKVADLEEKVYGSGDDLEPKTEDDLPF